ncbi:MAG: hypothetical protein AMXMBFR46_12510 [Acidimicrobiia bacterium]
MTGERRTVRTTPSFFEDLDRQLGSERGPNGEPSVNDFQVVELLRLVEVFATRWDDLPPLIPGRSDYRILIASGMLVPRLAVVGQLATDGAIELIEVDIDQHAGSG